MKGYVKGYKNLAWILRLILAIIPVTGWINAVLYRIAGGHLIAGIIAIPFGFIYWLVDLVTVILYGKPTIFA